MFFLRRIDGGAIDCIHIPGDPNRFPDGTLAIGKLPTWYDEILWLYESDDELFTLMCLRDHMESKDIQLIMPYIPHARMDRTQGGEVFTLKTFCKAINSMGFSEVVVADPHSSVSMALLDRAREYELWRIFGEVVPSMGSTREVVPNMVFFYPDEGAMKRYTKTFPNERYAFGMKNRDWATGKVKGLQIINSEAVEDKIVLIVDDICSKGGIFHQASKALADAGAREIYLYVTHCEPTVFYGDMYKDTLVKKIFTTDSIMPMSVANGVDRIKCVYSFGREFSNGKAF